MDFEAIANGTQALLRVQPNDGTELSIEADAALFCVDLRNYVVSRNALRVGAYVIETSDCVVYAHLEFSNLRV